MPGNPHTGKVKIGGHWLTPEKAVKWIKNNKKWVDKNYDSLYKNPKTYWLLAKAGAVKPGSFKGGDASDRGSQNNKGWAAKPQQVKKQRRQDLTAAEQALAGTLGAGNALIEGLAAATGLDPKVLGNLKAPNGQKLSLALAGKGARPMSPSEIDNLVKTIVTGQESTNLIESDIARERKQSAQNVQEVGGWYNQVLDSQARAAERDKQFGASAVQSAQDVGQAIMSSIGGEAAEGAGMVGASTNANVGGLQAIAFAQDEFNSELRPILEAEKASQMTREKNAGSARIHDLNRSLIQAKTQASADEANLRYQIWQANNQILNQRLDREIGIRQYNQALPQQRFQNNVTLAQMAMAGQAQNFNQDLQGKQFAAGVIANQQKAITEAMKQRAASVKQKGKGWGGTSFKDKQSFINDFYGSIMNADGTGLAEGMTPQKAIQIAQNQIRMYGWNPNNPQIQSAIMSVLQQAGLA